MHLFTLNYLFHKHGLIMVWDLRAYYGFRPEDIIDRSIIRDGACYVAAIGSYTWQEMDKSHADEFLAMCKRNQCHSPYKAEYPPYIVEPAMKEEERKNKLAASWKPKSPGELISIIRGGSRA